MSQDFYLEEAPSSLKNFTLASFLGLLRLLSLCDLLGRRKKLDIFKSGHVVSRMLGHVNNLYKNFCVGDRELGLLCSHDKAVLLWSRLLF